MSDQHMLRGQLIPLNQSTLLLPNIAIAEVSRFSGVEPLPSAPPWIHGLIEWRGLTLPLLNIDALLTDGAAVIAENQRIVVLNSISSNTETSFIAIAAAGNPHLMKLVEEALDDGLAEEHSSPYIHTQYPIGKKNALVPDLNAIEEHLCETMACSGF